MRTTHNSLNTRWGAVSAIQPPRWARAVGNVRKHFWDSRFYEERGILSYVSVKVSPIHEVNILSINLHRNGAAHRLEHRWSPGGGQRGSLAGRVACTLGAACAAPALWLQQQTYPVRRNLISSESRFSIWFVPRTCKKHSRLHAALTTDIHMHLNHLGFTFLRHIGELHSFGVCN